MKLSLEALAVLDAIERGGSFAQAAQELHRVPSAISYMVRKLESDLDVALFDRSGPRPRLTRAGRTLLRDGRQLLLAARALEERTRCVAAGWENELRLAVHQLLPAECMLPLCEKFYALESPTSVRLSHEVLGGSWDALHTGRADLVVGAPGSHPAGGGYSSAPLGRMPLAFVVAPDHPLAAVEEPIDSVSLQAYRAIALADTSRELPPQTRGILRGQDTLIVPDMRTKYLAQCAGLGVGCLPEYLAREGVRAGRLVIRELEEPVPPETLFVAWHSEQTGRALRWFLDELSKPNVIGHIVPFAGAA